MAADLGRSPGADHAGCKVLNLPPGFETQPRAKRGRRQNFKILGARPLGTAVPRPRAAAPPSRQDRDSAWVRRAGIRWPRSKPDGHAAVRPRDRGSWAHQGGRPSLNSQEEREGVEAFPRTATGPRRSLASTTGAVEHERAEARLDRAALEDTRPDCRRASRTTGLQAARASTGLAHEWMGRGRVFGFPAPCTIICRQCRGPGKLYPYRVKQEHSEIAHGGRRSRDTGC